MPTARNIGCFRDLLLLWPSRNAIARDLTVSYHTVTSWLRRDSVPPVWWENLIGSAATHGIRDVTYSRLCRIDAVRQALRLAGRTSRATVIAPLKHSKVRPQRKLVQAAQARPRSAASPKIHADEGRA